MKIPDFLKKYFWDVDFNGLDANTHSLFIVERILEYGDETATSWMLDNFSKEQIKQTLLERKGFSKKSANYWSLILNIPKDKISCLNRSYQQMQKSHWPY
ncbi:MAG: hypothetical protein ABR875_02045 [Minisyncoccia bacterium]|jgi:hypothetical protein